MPDLITHVAIAHIIKRGSEFTFFQERSAAFRVLFYLGTILPDILTRPFYIIFPATHAWTFPFHTPFGMFVICTLIAQFFEKAIRKQALISLMTGALLHFLLDFWQKQIIGGYRWLFPFSWKTVGIGCFWADEIIPLIPVWILAVIVIESCILCWNKKS